MLPRGIRILVEAMRQVSCSGGRGTRAYTYMMYYGPLILMFHIPLHGNVPYYSLSLYPMTIADLYMQNFINYC